jgi:hypothetical protein
MSDLHASSWVRGCEMFFLLLSDASLRITHSIVSFVTYELFFYKSTKAAQVFYPSGGFDGNRLSGRIVIQLMKPDNTAIQMKSMAKDA